MSEICPCNSGMAYSQCCQPYLNGQQNASTAGKLMRSRYTAYVKQDADYLIATWHPKCDAERWRMSLNDTFANTHWLGLRVIEESSGQQPDEQFVEFFARFSSAVNASALQSIHERSRFLRIAERWYYIDGSYPQSGRNDPCPCGSGKKYKKCCAR